MKFIINDPYIKEKGSGDKEMKKKTDRAYYTKLINQLNWFK